LAEQGGDHARVVGQVGGIGHVSCLVAVHKLTSVKVTGGGGARDHTYVYDASNRLVNIKNTVGGATVVGLGYDPQGNLANKNGQTYSFTYGNRLRAAPGKETYLYDGHGRRVESRTTNYSVWQYSQSGQVMYSRDARNNRKTNYIYLGGSLVALREQPMSGGTTAAVKYQHTDALGTPVAVTDAAKAIVETFEYEPYGQLVNSTLKDGPGFTGHVQDAATGLTYMQQRYYDPQVGLFLSVDPVTAYSNPLGMFNRYWYANNNPYKFTDPDGRCSLGILCDFLPAPRSDRTNPYASVPGADRGDRYVVGGLAVTATAGAGAALVVPVATAVASNPAAVATVGEVVAEAAGVTGVASGVSLTAKQASNLARFEKSLPAGNTGTAVDALGDGVVFTSTVPGNVPGSQAVYQKTVDAAGDTSSFLKTTIDAKGNVIHIKDKINNTQLPKY
jgi:RHS repeat-associated protein